MCKIRPGSGHFLDLPGKTKENLRTTRKTLEFQGLNFLELIFHTPYSMNSLFSEFFRDFWPGFLALDRRTGGGSGVVGGWGEGGGREIQFYSTTGTKKYSITILFTIYYSVFEKSKSLF